jgi:glycosyltransferase involved in cell wall biosynthesis
MNIAIIIVAFGRKELMQQTLDSLFATQIDEGDQVIVVDNGSQPELIQMLVSYRDKIDNLILLKQNMGKPYALNLGIHTAMEVCIVTGKKTPDYFLLCDSDLLFVDKDWRQKAVTTYQEHADLPLCALSLVVWSSHPTTDIRKGPTTAINLTPRWPAGASILVSKQALEKNGLWDTRRFIGTVDTSWFRTALQRGYKHGAVYPIGLVRHTGIQQRSWNLANHLPKLLP